jgi:DNA sulfur modification protein DndC
LDDRHEAIVAATMAAIRHLYGSDDTPWVIGYSGGKDSSTVAQLTYRVLAGLPAKDRHKQVHIIASDTLVESPVVQEYLDRTLAEIRSGAEAHGLPIVVRKVVPELSETFWVMLLGRGYPSPNRFFRWCTERLKINPATRYIQREIDEWGSVVILLGARKAESSSRAQVLENHRIAGSQLRRHATMPQALVYAPIADWGTHDVWSYLLVNEAPWAPDLRLNSKLRDLYRDGAGGECPLVIDKSTPSCGQSRFGCWTCTVVDVDNSMEGFLEVGRQYEWMRPLAEYRNKLKSYRNDPSKREKWRRNNPNRPRGWLHESSRQTPEQPALLDEDGYEVLGPFTLEVRMELLEELLRIQKETGHTLICPEEIELIRRHWTEDYRVTCLWSCHPPP